MNTLKTDTYLAICVERNMFSAAMKGHGPIFPQAVCTVIDEQVVFARDGKELWRCEAAYAAAYFAANGLSLPESSIHSLLFCCCA